MDVKDKVVIVTGGARGIGYAIVEHFLKNGAQYVGVFDLFERDDDRVTNSFSKLAGTFEESRFEYYRCDVTDDKQFRDNYMKVFKLKNYVDVLVNNAGVADENNYARMIDINYTAVVRGTLIAIEHMRLDKGHKGGVVVNIASFLGLVNASLAPVYNGTKHAVVSFTRSMKSHFDKLGVRVNAVCPGMTVTDMIEPSTMRKNVFEFVTDEMVHEPLSIYQQKPDNVAFAVVEIVLKGKPGDVWLAQNDEPYVNTGEETDLNKLRVPF
ncbi:hypothetical protein TKK_0010930 [Trichogramma kaykai]|uniref:15-hydroxyprostaglandin dehydrogenase [NAD(+)] n=1 Tax=Trichogramma kaykai TaxID=54128 RepID=A0ABD2WUZ9_9HYME